MLGASTRDKRSDIGRQKTREKIKVENNNYERTNMSFYPTASPTQQEVVDITTTYFAGPDFTVTRHPRPYEGKL